ncbi:AT-hook motif nuclear-localized protein 10-like [Apium graveolens]|uniref:AT-hook motif nuclear-localized protein 10-like n=1 Tax=Apium graveolens TaxID=4045 RepID=UPI003D79F1C6
MEPEKKQGGTTKEPASQLLISNVRPTYNADGTPVLEPLTGSFPPPLSNRETVIGLPHQKYGRDESRGRKRGRAKKYGQQGCMAFSSQLQHSAATSALGGSTSEAPVKKRGRPPGSAKKHKMEAPLGTARMGFIPRMVTVQPGEDVSSKLISSSQNGPSVICVLSGSGTISTVTLRHAANSGGTTTYEGLFDVLSISGSFSLSGEGGQQSRTGGLSISLACQDGRFLGGCVAGPIIAASAVQVVVGNFIEEEHRDHNATNQIKPSSATQQFIPGGDSTGPSSSPLSHGTHSESSGRAGCGSPLNRRKD